MPSEVATGGTEKNRELTVDELKRELSEAHRREAASADVLKVIGRSSFNLQEVLDSLIESAVRLTGAEMGLIYRQDGEFYRAAAIYGASPEFVEVVKRNPIPPSRQSATGRAVLERRVIHIKDVVDDPEYTWAGQQGAEVRTILAVPMLREDVVVGVIVTRRTTVQPFTDKQIELLTTFADQAVIAIENTRLFEEVQTRTRELTETLRYQTATADVLSVISRSKSDVRPVFETIVKSAAELFDPWDATITTLHDGQLHWQATAAARQSAMRMRSVRSIYPIPFDPDRVPSARAMVERRVIEITDATMDGTPEFVRRAQATGGFRSIAFVPLVREDKGIGVIILTHPDAGYRLTEKQRALVQTFAEQAVIAIENTRLLNELRGSLQQQTATADVLKVINRSAFNLQTVLAELIRCAVPLCEADFGHIRQRVGELYLRATWCPA
jgi:GAF domain-containing protein